MFGMWGATNIIRPIVCTTISHFNVAKYFDSLLWKNPHFERTYYKFQQNSEARDTAVHFVPCL